MTEYNIRLNPNCAAAVHTGLKFKAGDKGITFRIAVDELDTTGTTAKIVFLRANGTSVESDISGTDGVYIYKTLGNEFAVPGKTVADVKFYESGNRESTASFIFEVCGDTMNGLGAGTGGYSDRLEQLVSEAEAAGELTEQAKAELEAAESNMKSTEAEMAAVIQNFKNQYGEVGALNPRGNWNSDVRYQIRDLAYHNSSSWICLAPNTGVAPTDANIAYWMRSTDLESILNGTTPVGNANKLGGYEGTKYVRFLGQIADVNFLNDATIPYPYECVVTTDVASAIGLPPTYWYVKFQPYSMPQAGYSTQVVTPMDPITKVEDPMFRVALGTNWYPWKYYSGGNADTVDGAHLSDIKGWAISQFLKLDGSVPMSTDLFVAGGHARVSGHGDHAQLEARNTVGSAANRRTLVVRNSLHGSAPTVKTALVLQDIVDSVVTTYDVLHTGNSQKVVTSASAPSDTSAVWIDSANKVNKIYIDGAWTALA